jgi:hypothetical protein
VFAVIRHTGVLTAISGSLFATNVTPISPSRSRGPQA